MNTLLPFLLSIFLPGGGQIILKDYWKGIAMLLLALVVGFFIPFIPYSFFYFGTMIWSLFDIYMKTEKSEGKSKAVKNLIFSIIIMVIIIPTVFYLSIVSFSVGGKYVADNVLNSKHTDKEMIEIKNELESYFNYYKKYPDNFKTFVGRKPIWSNWKTDSWGNQYKYIQKDSIDFKLISSGKDEIFNTEDDLIISNEE